MARKRRHRGDGSIVKLKSGSFRAFVSVTGPDGRHRISKAFPTREEAQAWKNDQLARGKPTAAGTVGDWLTTWLELHKARVGPATYRTDRQTAERHLRPALGSVRLRDLDALRIERWLAGLQTAGVSQNERHKAGKTLRNVLFAAVRANLIPSNPMHGRIRVPGQPKPKARWLTPEELARVLAAADDLGHGTMFRLWLELGLRPGELIGLRWDDYDPDRGTVEITRSIELGTNQVVPPKTPRDAPLPLSRPVRDQLEVYRAGRRSGVMFPTSTGWHWWAGNFWDHVWRPVMQRAKVKAGRYVLRHTCASLLISRGVNIVIVAKRLGHSNPAITLKVYAHAMPDDQHRAAEVWGKIFSESIGTR